MGIWTLIPGAAFHSLALCDSRGRERGAASRSSLQKQMHKATPARPTPTHRTPTASERRSWMIRAAFEGRCGESDAGVRDLQRPPAVTETMTNVWREWPPPQCCHLSGRTGLALLLTQFGGRFGPVHPPPLHLATKNHLIKVSSDFKEQPELIHWTGPGHRTASGHS